MMFPYRFSFNQLLFFPNQWRRDLMKGLLVAVGWACNRNTRPVFTDVAAPTMTWQIRSLQTVVSQTSSNHPWWRLPLPLPSSYRCCAHYRCCLEKLSPVCIHNHLLLSSFADVVWYIASSPSSRRFPLHLLSFPCLPCLPSLPLLVRACSSDQRKQHVLSCELRERTSARAHSCLKLTRKMANFVSINTDVSVNQFLFQVN